MIDFTLTEEQRAMKESARKFAQGELRPLLKQLEDLSDPWECFRRTRDVYRKAAQMGLTRGFVPAEYGGLGLGTLDYAVAAEELVKVDLGVPSTILANGLALAPLIYFGTEEQKRKWLPPIAKVRTRRTDRTSPRTRSPTWTVQRTSIRSSPKPAFEPTRACRAITT